MAPHGADPLIAHAVKRIAAGCPDNLLGTRDALMLNASGAFRARSNGRSSEPRPVTPVGELQQMDRVSMIEQTKPK